MKLFPEKSYVIELNNSDQFLNSLQENSLPRDIFISSYNNQNFIGEITDSEFRITLSSRILSFFCEFQGKINQNKCLIKTGLHKHAKLFFSLVFIIIIALIPFSIFYGIKNPILPLLAHLLIIRFIYIELGYRFFLWRGLKKFKKINGVISILPLNF